MSVRDIVICGACGAPVGEDDTKCSYCKSIFKSSPQQPEPISRKEGLPRYRATTNPTEPVLVRVINLKDGQSGYMVPWGIGTNGVQKNYSVMISDEPRGTAEVKIKKEKGCLYVDFFHLLRTERHDWPADISLPYTYMFF
ncbi:hypothetical protein A2572_01625 [Candidatus Collierbacteria bacterium RIFOXYD1_FULL_40_9]|uniref:Uncharacterized protein n=1 Tax=Candidatus Collierbacteria bacterium RIFOXYD1_FULL_40_9 TaxID=1817731 RepID=A0A1F5FP79_9BACT|nr:MAG: hypothetical protein A2572_01625 [Candidatus Collierbacteria bacterium RIFOXYD1_FULL_40_9]